MAKKRFCNEIGCKETIDIPLIEFSDVKWTAFQIPNGKGEVVSYCPKHNKEGQEYMKDCLLKIKPTKQRGSVE